MTMTTQLVDITDAPRFTAEIREQLSDLGKVIEVARRHGTRDFASQVGWESLILHEQELLAELAESEIYEQAQKGAAAQCHQHETLRLQGKLVGGSLEAGHFELRVGDDLYTGDVAELAKAEMRKLRFGADVEAEVEIATVSVPSRLESQLRYLLRSVNPVVGS